MNLTRACNPAHVPSAQKLPEKFNNRLKNSTASGHSKSWSLRSTASGLIPAKKPAMLWRMALQMRWVGNDELDRVAETRWMCYAHARKGLARFKENIHAGPWGRPGDYLLAERNGEAVGTASSYAMTMWVARGGGFVPGGGVCGHDQERPAARGEGAGGGIRRHAGGFAGWAGTGTYRFGADAVPGFVLRAFRVRAGRAAGGLDDSAFGFAGGGLRRLANQHGRGSDGADGSVATLGGIRPMRHRAIGRAMEIIARRMKRRG